MVPTGYACTGDLYYAPSGLDRVLTRLPRASAKAAFCGFHLCPGLSYFAPLGLKSARGPWHVSLLNNTIPKYFCRENVGNDKGLRPWLQTIALWAKKTPNTGIWSARNTVLVRRKASVGGSGGGSALPSIHGNHNTLSHSRARPPVARCRPSGCPTGLRGFTPPPPFRRWPGAFPRRRSTRIDFDS